MQRTTPDLSITASVERGELIFIFKTRTAECPVPVAIGEAQLDECRNALNAGLVRFRATVGNGTQTLPWGKISRALQDLHTAGRELLFQLFELEQPRVSAFVQSAMPAWLRSAADGYNAPVVEIRGRPPQLLPFELLPLLDPSKPGDVANADDLMRVAARFLGFSAIVYRAGPSGPPATDVLENESSLRVRFFHHAGLKAAGVERRFFEDAKWVDFRGPWPETELRQDQFLEQLVAYLWHASEPPHEPAAALDHVQHFACHCNTERKESREHSLDLAHAFGVLDTLGWATHVRRARLGDIQAELTSRMTTSPRRTPSALVFLNACGTSHVTSTGVGSFPEVFLGIGSRGVIGTETRIPDAFAAAFSEKFYLNLIRGQPVGSSLFMARWSLLKHLRNPLGILYSLFGSPDLSVQRPQSSAVSPLMRVHADVDTAASSNVG